MNRRPKQTQKEDPLTGCHFNIKCEGDIVFNRVTQRYFQGFRPEVITLAWCVELRRELTRKEIQRLCSGG